MYDHLNGKAVILSFTRIPDFRDYPTTSSTRKEHGCILMSMLCAGAEGAGLFHTAYYGGF